jgi:Flp pilus assembly protein TadG
MKRENATSTGGFGRFFRSLLRDDGRDAVLRGHLRGHLKSVFQAESGSVLVEFSILAPMLVVMWVGVLQFGLILQNKATLQDAVHQGAQTMSAGRTIQAIYTDTIDQVEAAAGSLAANMTVTLSVCNASGASCSPCSTNCATLMHSGDAAQVSATYPCVLAYSLFNLGSSCTISATEETLIQ